MINKRIVLTGGGTAGHVTPNLALLPRLRELGYDVRYIGTAKGIERGLVTSENVPYYTIPAGKLRRYLDLKNITDIVRIKLGFFRSLFLMAKIRPQVLFSKGGFVSCPVVWAAWVCRVPVVIHESDLSPGLANKLSIPFAAKVCYSFPETASRLPVQKAVETGIPVRASLLGGDPEKGRALCGFNDRKPVIMVIGGSQGARAINECVRTSLGRILPDFNLCHLCGKGNVAEERNGYAQFEYVNSELADLVALADLAVSRAGATTLFELLALKKPALLIPLPLAASRGDQILNARSFEKQGFSRVLLQEHMTPDSLVESIGAVFRERQIFIGRMRGKPARDATEKIVALISDLTH